MLAVAGGGGGGVMHVHPWATSGFGLSLGAFQLVKMGGGCRRFFSENKNVPKKFPKIMRAYKYLFRPFLTSIFQKIP